MLLLTPNDKYVPPCQNLKKSWHPQTMKNIERVWKAEQKYEAERKKIEELQKELKDERSREEMTRYAEETGAIKLVLRHIQRAFVWVETKKEHLRVVSLSVLMLTERETIAWTGCTRVQLDRCPGMSTWWDVPLTSRSLTSMQSLRAVLQLRLVSCPAPSSTLPLPPPTSTWLPRSEKTLCLKSGEFVRFPCDFSEKLPKVTPLTLCFLYYLQETRGRKEERSLD